MNCQRRFTTYENIEEAALMVIKKDGRREPFDRKKILSGLTKACEKRPISADQLEALTDKIEYTLQSKFEKKAPSKEIGELLMELLYKLDEVAYVRFAYVYREFKDVADFVNEVRPMLSTEGDTKKKAEGSEP